MLEQWEVGSYLLGLGLVSARSVMKGDLAISNASRRNNNFQAVCEGGNSFILKQSSDVDTTLSIRREALIYQYLHDASAAEVICGYLPRFYSYEDEQRILILELLKDAEDLHRYHRRIGRFPVWVGAQMGRALADLHHQDTADRHLFQQLQIDFAPWALSLHHPSPSQLRDMSGSSLQLVKMLQQATELRSMLDELRGRWQVNALVHGDIKGTNWIVSRAAKDEGRPRLKLIDWEMAGVGDSRWDVGSVFADYLSLWLFSMTINTEEEPEEYVRKAGYPLVNMQPAIRRFWETYARQMSFSQAQAREFLSGAVMYAGARLVQTAYEHGQELSRITMSGVSLLQLASNIIQKPLEAAVDLLGIEPPEGEQHD